jgi:hypothetical protein
MCLSFNVLDTRSVYRVYEHKAKIYALGYPIGYQNRRRIFAFSSPVFRRKKIGRRFAAAAQQARRNRTPAKKSAAANASNAAAAEVQWREVRTRRT